EQRECLVRIVAAVAGGTDLALGGHRIAKIELYPREQEARLRVLRIGLHRVQQLHLSGLQVALLQRQPAVGEKVGRLPAQWPDRGRADRQNTDETHTEETPAAHCVVPQSRSVRAKSVPARSVRPPLVAASTGLPVSGSI